MALTLSVVSGIIDNNVTTDATIQTAVRVPTTAHIYGFSIIPISNTTSRWIMVYD